MTPTQPNRQLGPQAHPRRNERRVRRRRGGRGVAGCGDWA